MISSVNCCCWFVVVLFLVLFLCLKTKPTTTESPPISGRSFRLGKTFLVCKNHTKIKNKNKNWNFFF